MIKNLLDGDEPAGEGQEEKRSRLRDRFSGDKLVSIDLSPDAPVSVSPEETEDEIKRAIREGVTGPETQSTADVSEEVPAESERTGLPDEASERERELDRLVQQLKDELRRTRSELETPPVAHDDLDVAVGDRIDPPTRRISPPAASGLSPLSSIPSEDETETFRKSGLAWSAAIALFGSVAFMLVLGWVADTLLGTSPWGIVVGIVLGSLIGFIQFFRINAQILRPSGGDFEKVSLRQELPEQAAESEAEMTNNVSETAGTEGPLSADENEL